MSGRNVWIPWFVAYVLVMAALLTGMCLARRAVMANYSSPEALAEWRQWKAETQRMSHQPGPVQRRTVTSDEPPALVLMRDSFAAILSGSVAIGSFLFAFLAFTIRGSIRMSSPERSRGPTPGR